MSRALFFSGMSRALFFSGMSRALFFSGMSRALFFSGVSRALFFFEGILVKERLKRVAVRLKLRKARLKHNMSVSFNRIEESNQLDVVKTQDATEALCILLI
ncbi:MAG: hypothetical protein RLZZ338_4532 [Cyanobacteriota bacterium]